MHRITMAFADGLLLTGGAGVAPALSAEKLKAATVPAVDPALLHARDRLSAYLRSLQGFQVISSACLEEVIDETGKTPPTRSAHEGFVLDMGGS